AAGYDELAPAFGNIAGTVSGLGIGAWLNPKVTIGSFAVESTTGMGLRALGVNDQDAAILGGLAGMATGGVMASRQAGPSVRALLRADTARLTPLAAEFETTLTRDVVIDTPSSSQIQPNLVRVGDAYVFRQQTTALHVRSAAEYAAQNGASEIHIL